MLLTYHYHGVPENRNLVISTVRNFNPLNITRNVLFPKYTSKTSNCDEALKEGGKNTLIEGLSIKQKMR